MNIFRKAQENERNLHASLYVGNLDPEVSETLLYELFLQVGPVRSLNLPKDRVSRTHQGYGFVEFSTPPDAAYALDILRGVRLFGKTLKMKKMDPSGPAAHVPDSRVLSVGAIVFVNGLNALVDEKYLRHTFSRFGDLVDVAVRRDAAGVSKGYGTVEFADFDSSDDAIAKMDGAILMNSRVALSYAYKEGLVHKKVRHGDEAERTLANEAKKNLAKGARR